MKIVILGVGKVGATLVESFVNEGHDVVAIDKDESKISYIVNKFDANGVVGGGLERTVLDEAGVDSADFFISCTSRDETNILCCVFAKKFGAKRTIARVRDPEYYKEMESLREFLELDLAFNPEYRTAIDIIDILKFPSAKSVESFAGGKALILEFQLLKDNPLIDKNLKEITSFLGLKVLVCMVKRGKSCFIPKGDSVLKEQDDIFVIATESELTRFCKKLKIFKPRAKSVFIVGGGKIAYYLAKGLIKDKVNVKIVEQDPKRCEELSDELSYAEVLCGDGTDQTTLNEEGIKDSDACVTLTGMDEENVIISLYAKQNGLGKVVTKVNRPSITSMVSLLGLDAIVSPRISISNHIVRFVRSCAAMGGEGLNALYKLYESVEAVEFTLDGGFKGLGVPLSQLELQKNILIGGIVRGDEFILPGGDTKFITGDRIVVVTMENKITEPNGILK